MPEVSMHLFGTGGAPLSLREVATSARSGGPLATDEPNGSAGKAVCVVLPGTARVEQPCGGERHAQLDYVCSRIHAMTVGHAASRLLGAPEPDASSDTGRRIEPDLDTPDGLPSLDLRRPRPAVDVIEEAADDAGTVALWVPPAWSWRLSGIDVGRKDISYDTGERLLMPIRVAFEQEPIVVLDTGSVRHKISWQALGLGLEGNGVTTVHLSAYGHADEGDIDEVWHVPESVSVPLLTLDEARAVLADLVRLGAQAQWELLTAFEEHVTTAISTAHTSVCLELRDYWGEVRYLLDSVKIEHMVDVMLLGDEQRGGYVLPLLERCMKPGLFMRTEPLKYIRDSMRREANQVIRRALGDPHVGPKVRKIALELGTRDVDAIVAVYRERHPQDRLSVDRAVAALSVGPDAMAGWNGLRASEDESAG